MLKLKKIDCCWYCKNNAKCHMGVTGEANGKVCEIENPCLEECTACDIYIKYEPCRDFSDK